MGNSDENTKIIIDNLGRIEDKVDKLEAKLEAKIDKHTTVLSSIDSTLAAQHESLRDHMRRTELLEEEIKPMKNHMAVVNFVGKIAIAILGSGFVWEVIKWLFK